MAKELIKDFYGKVIGSYEMESNGDIIVRDFYGKNLGKYDAALDVTKDFYGKIVAKGNAVGMLLGSLN